jgi:hypothetical protein
VFSPKNRAPWKLTRFSNDVPSKYASSEKRVVKKLVSFPNVVNRKLALSPNRAAMKSDVRWNSDSTKLLQRPAEQLLDSLQLAINGRCLQPCPV